MFYPSLSSFIQCQETVVFNNEDNISPKTMMSTTTKTDENLRKGSAHQNQVAFSRPLLDYQSIWITWAIVRESSPKTWTIIGQECHLSRHVCSIRGCQKGKHLNWPLVFDRYFSVWPRQSLMNCTEIGKLTLAGRPFLELEMEKSAGSDSDHLSKHLKTHQLKAIRTCFIKVLWRM